MHDSSTAAVNHSSWLVRCVPAIGWLRAYQSCWLRADLVAGVTLAAYLIPSGIGDATLAGLPPAAGLYACIFSGLVFWLFTGSRQTSITVTSAISLLVGSSLAPLAAGNPSHYAALAAGTAVLVAALALLAWAVRAGSIVNFISETVPREAASSSRSAGSRSRNYTPPRPLDRLAGRRRAGVQSRSRPPR